MKSFSMTARKAVPVLLTVVIVFLLVVGLAGCGASPTEAATPPQSQISIWETVRPVLLDLIVSALVALLGLLSTWVLRLVKKLIDRTVAQTQAIKDKAKALLISGALERLHTVVANTVAALEQTVAGEMRKAVKDGKVERKELENLASVAYREVRQTLGSETLLLLKDTLGDLQQYIQSRIEAEVLLIKTDLYGTHPVTVPTLPN